MIDAYRMRKLGQTRTARDHRLRNAIILAAAGALAGASLAFVITRCLVVFECDDRYCGRLVSD